MFDKALFSLFQNQMDCVPHFELESTGDLRLDKTSSSVDIIDIEKDKKLDEIKTIDNFNDNSNFQSDEKGEFGDQSEQENNEISIIYFCSMCPDNFDEKSSLFKHFTAVHEKIKKLDCDICNSHFRIESQLKIHKKTVHEKLKPYECKFCKATFGHKQNMKRHIKNVHEKLKSFVCQVCEATFVLNKNLQCHMKNVHSQWKPCKLCAITILTEGSLEVTCQDCSTKLESLSV